MRRVGGFIQAAFAAFWLGRASLAIGGRAGDVLLAVSAVAVIGVFAYAIKVTASTAPRPAGPEARRIERSVTVATVIELVAAFVLPVIVIAAGHSDWVLPSVVITIGPLLLYLDHLVHIPRYRPVGWALTAGPIILVATMSGSALAVTTGIAAGVILLGTAAELPRPRRHPGCPPARPGLARHEGMSMPQADTPAQVARTIRARLVSAASSGAGQQVGALACVGSHRRRTLEFGARLIAPAEPLEQIPAYARQQVIAAQRAGRRETQVPREQDDRVDHPLGRGGRGGRCER